MTDFKVVLSGQGGDEALMGYLKYYFYAILQAAKKGNFLWLIKLIFGALFNKTIFNQFNFKNANKYINNTSNSNFIIESNINQKFNFRNLKDRQILDIKKYSVPRLRDTRTEFNDVWNRDQTSVSGS